MKKITLSLLCLIALGATAQVPNAGFETWITPTGASYQEPDLWSTSNGPLAGIGETANVSQSTTPEAHSGVAAARLQTSSILAGFAKASAALVSGTITYVSTPSPTFVFSGGFPYTSRPGGLGGFYNYTPGANDSARFEVLLTKWNTSSSTRDTIAAGLWNPKDATGGYMPFNVPLNYFSAFNPDTALIVFLTSNGIIAGNTNSTLLLDDLQFQFAAGINGVNTAKQIKTYPNPATDRLMIDMVPGQYANAFVYDLTGRLVNTLNVIGTSIDISGLNNGQYVLELRNGNDVSRSTFAKQ